MIFRDERRCSGPQASWSIHLVWLPTKYEDKFYKTISPIDNVAWAIIIGVGKAMKDIPDYINSQIVMSLRYMW